MKRIIAVIVLAALTMPANAVNYESLSYLYGGSTSTYLNLVSRTNNALTTVCPDYFSIKSDGSVQVVKTPDPLLIESMHRQGIKVTPYYSNNWSRTLGRAALAKSDAVASELVKYVTQYNMDGLDIDVQNLNEDDRTAFTVFIQKLRTKLPAGKTLSVCLAANPWNLSVGWQGQYDYKALGQSVDYIFIMTYDESFETGPAGPVASYGFIEDSIKYALKHVPANKIMIGIPFYGRYWISGQASGGKALTVSDINGLVGQYGTRVWYDEQKECARATMTITQSNVSAGLWGNKKLSAGTYDIWYENDRSWEKKLSLVKKYNLRGAGSWALGQEPAGTWANYRKWLYGLAFNDIGGHWAEGAITELKNKGIVAGDGIGLYYPNKAMTRAELCVMLCRLTNIEPLAAKDAPDEVKNHWAAGFIAAMLKYNLISGYPDGSIRPNNLVRRDEASVMIANVLNVSHALDFQEDPFSDVAAGSWAAASVTVLKNYGVVSGKSPTIFEPWAVLTRAESAQMIYKASLLPIRDVTTPLKTVIEPR